MESLAIWSPLLLTSGVAYWLGVAVLGLDRRQAWAAVVAALETVALAAVFVVANVALALGVLLGLRLLTGTFVSLYPALDLTWGGLSLLQGLAFGAWRGRRVP
jgi:heme/copper-type cytochrome/quinol oxidase subunit 3